MIWATSHELMVLCITQGYFLIYIWPAKQCVNLIFNLSCVFSFVSVSCHSSYCVDSKTSFKYDNISPHYSETSNHIELIKWYRSRSSNDHWVSSHSLSKRVVLGRDQSMTASDKSFLKSNYTTVCCALSSQFPSFSLVCRTARVCTHKWACACILVSIRTQSLCALDGMNGGEVGVSVWVCFPMCV